MAGAKGHKKIQWSSDDSLIEIVRLLAPYMTYADIGRLVGKDRRTIHYVAKTYNISKKEKRKLPLIVIKSRDKYEEEYLSLKDLEK